MRLYDLGGLSRERIERLAEIYLKTIPDKLQAGYIPFPPTDKQGLFLFLSDIEEVFFGGAAGGGKSICLLMAALQYVHIPGYAAIIFRKTYTDLSLPSALMDISHQWLSNTDAKWEDKTKTWHFPSGATVTFGYLDGPRDKYRYQGSAYQFQGFDELTQIRQSDYEYLASRLRRTERMLDVPLRVRATANPGGDSHDFVKDHFVSYPGEDRIFIPSLMTDNPFLDHTAYRNSLSRLDPVTRAQLEDGDWDITFEGNLFKRHWFGISHTTPISFKKRVRFWDLAASNNPDKSKLDWCTGLLMGRIDNKAVVLDLIHVRLDPGDIEKTIAMTARMDGVNTEIDIEQEGGAAAVLLIDNWKKNLLKGYHVEYSKPNASKVVRAQLVSAAAKRGDIEVVQAEWNNEFFSELLRFPEGVHDDIVDCLSGSYNRLFEKPQPMRHGDIPMKKHKRVSGGFSG